MKNYIKIFKDWQEDFELWWRYCFIKDALKSISNFISPQQSWAVKGIYHNWMDKPEFILEILYRSIVHYVEAEKCFERIDWETREEDKECASFIKKTYKWIKVERPKLVKKIDEIISNGFSQNNLDDPTSKTLDLFSSKSYEEIYPGLDDLKSELEKKDQEYLALIIKWRRYLWV